MDIGAERGVHVALPASLPRLQSAHEILNFRETKPRLIVQMGWDGVYVWGMFLLLQEPSDPGVVG